MNKVTLVRSSKKRNDLVPFRLEKNLFDLNSKLKFTENFNDV